MRQCDGALILALMRHHRLDGNLEEFTKNPSARKSARLVPIPSEYSHFEGALALSRRLPTIVIAEEGMEFRGIVDQYDGSVTVAMPMDRASEWLASGSLLHAPPFEKWASDVKSRYDVFFGYCSQADSLAKNIKTYLVQKRRLRVLDWASDFKPGRTIMEEIARAAALCRCGLFLFTKDDPIDEKGAKSAASGGARGRREQKIVPRDNVLLEAGYFISAHTARRVLVVREKGTKMPSDLGGIIYENIEKREVWEPTARRVADVLFDQMNNDTAR
jgi:predicted nucleotide-binding protein